MSRNVPQMRDKSKNGCGSRTSEGQTDWEWWQTAIYICRLPLKGCLSSSLAYSIYVLCFLSFYLKYYHYKDVERPNDQPRSREVTDSSQVVSLRDPNWMTVEGVWKNLLGETEWIMGRKKRREEVFLLSSFPSTLVLRYRYIVLIGCLLVSWCLVWQSV